MDDASFRQPNATNLERCTSFNKENVNQFFDKLSILLIQCNIPLCHRCERGNSCSQSAWNSGSKGNETRGIRNNRRSMWNDHYTYGCKRLRKCPYTAVHSSQEVIRRPIHSW